MLIAVSHAHPPHRYRHAALRAVSPAGASDLQDPQDGSYNPSPGRSLLDRAQILRYLHLRAEQLHILRHVVSTKLCSF